MDHLHTHHKPKRKPQAKRNEHRTTGEVIVIPHNLQTSEATRTI